MPRPRNGPPSDQFTPEMFYFWRHDPGKGAVGGTGQIQKGQITATEWKLQFEAHIIDISDGSSPSWNDSYDMGRADPKVFYAGMNRTISVNFVVVALNEHEHFHNHEVLLARLGRLTYPLYQDTYGYNGPHVLFQIGRLIKGYGVITSLNYTWNNETPWVENRPLYTDVNLSIKILGDSIGRRPNIDKSAYFWA